MTPERLEAETAVANFLMEKIRLDRFPSSTQMQILEEFIPRHLLRDYLNVLLEKVLMDTYPSTTMLRRIARVAQAM